MTRAAGRLSASGLAMIAIAVWIVACGSSEKPVGVASGPHTSGNPKILVSQVSTDPGIPAGEAWVMTDPRDPLKVLVIWLATRDRVDAVNLLTVPGYCGVARSIDGGRTWSEMTQPFAPSDPPICGDPVGGVGPDGTIYLGADQIGSVEWTAGIASSDWGQTWAPLTEIFGLDQMLAAAAANPGHRTPAIALGREYMAVDQITGEVSVNSQEDGGMEGRWLTVSKDHGANWSVPRPLDPDIQSNTAGPQSAADGTIAVAYVVVPSSLEYLLSPSPAVVCVQPCTVFETTSDQGASWTRHIMPNENVPGEKIVAADPSHLGRFAVLLGTSSGSTLNTGTVLDFNNVATALEIWRTDDNGVNWTQTKVLKADPGDSLARPWITYSPTGVLGAVWRVKHADGTTRPFAIVSRDGGTSFSAAIALTDKVIPPDPQFGPGDDCACNLHLDATSLSATWADSSTGQRQIYYGRFDYTDLPASGT